MAQGMDRSVREVESFASNDQEPLQRGARHRAGGLVHAGRQGLGSVIATAHIGKKQEGMPMKTPVTAKLLPHGSG